MSALAAAPACGDDNGDDAQFRVVHTSPDAPAVDIFIAGQTEPFIEDVEFAEASNFQDLAPGIYEFEVRPAEADGSDEPLLVTDPVEVRAGEDTTAIAAGRADPDAETNRFRVLLARESVEEDPEDQALVRFVHTAVDAPTVGIDVGADGSEEVVDLAPLSASAAPGVGVPTDDDVQVALRAEDEPITAFTAPDLSGDQDLLAIVLGRVQDDPQGRTGLRLLLVDDRGVIERVEQNPVVFALHAASDAPSVDLLLDGEQFLATNLSFGELSEPIQLPPGDPEFVFKVAGLDESLISEDIDELEAGERYLASVVGSAAEDDLDILTRASEFSAPAPSVRVIHGIPDADAVDVSLIDGDSLATPLIAEDLGFSESTQGEGEEIPAGEQVVGLARAGEATPIARFQVDVAEDARVFAVAAGALDPREDERSATLLLVNTTPFPWTVSQAPIDSAAP